MPSVFSMVIAGDLPGRFVWEDDRCVAFLSINPIVHGHVLVVPREEVDHWIDLDEELWAHVSEVTRLVGKAVQHAFGRARVGTVVAGFEVPHVHVHVFPADDMATFDFRRADPDPDPAELDAAAAAIRGAVRELGFTQGLPAD